MSHAVKLTNWTDFSILTLGEFEASWQQKWACRPSITGRLRPQIGCLASGVRYDYNLLGFTPRTSRCITEKGKEVTFYWARRDDGKWDNWASGSTSTGVVTIEDEDRWRIEGLGETLVFKRVGK